MLEDAGLQVVANWATNLSAGPLDEAGQTLTFVVTDNSKRDLFATQPTITRSGRSAIRTYRPAPNANGIAVITVVLRDSGGTANNGSNTSTQQAFNIIVTGGNGAPPLNPGGNLGSGDIFVPDDYSLGNQAVTRCRMLAPEEAADGGVLGIDAGRATDLFRHSVSRVTDAFALLQPLTIGKWGQNDCGVQGSSNQIPQERNELNALASDLSDNLLCTDAGWSSDWNSAAWTEGKAPDVRGGERLDRKAYLEAMDVLYWNTELWLEGGNK